jgi:hypothetical protein
VAAADAAVVSATTTAAASAANVRGRCIPKLLLEILTHPSAQRTKTPRRRSIPLVAGYSSTPLARKLGVKPGARLALDGAPDGWRVPELPPGVETPAEGEPADVVVAFFREASDLPGRLPRLAGRIFPAGSLWVAWPRRAGGHESDITENGLRDHALPLGIVDTKVAALDEDWSGLKFMWRRELRSAPPPPTG